MRYLVVIEKTSNNFSAFLPDVPGCVATGKSIEEVKKNIAEALAMHLEGLAEDGQPAPEPKAQADYVNNPTDKSE
ncbi:MAG: type II toxin-antitoxin system HicB family antitoxin [Firmicutes bacterium]|nr:type II toxin-antitoxin system HicB family antitoxin [Bacillota bacterium]